jgi:hypothetical protein
MIVISDGDNKTNWIKTFNLSNWVMINVQEYDNKDFFNKLSITY